MSDSLSIYLHDHLAGSVFAIDLVASLHDRYSGDPLGDFAAELRLEIEEDRKLLQGIRDRVGKAPPDLKEATAFVAEKVARLKLSHDDTKGLGTFQALETLALGILGISPVARSHNRCGDR